MQERDGFKLFLYVPFNRVWIRKLKNHLTYIRDILVFHQYTCNELWVFLFVVENNLFSINKFEFGFCNLTYCQEGEVCLNNKSNFWSNKIVIRQTRVHVMYACNVFSLAAGISFRFFTSTMPSTKNQETTVTTRYLKMATVHWKWLRWG